MQPIQEMIQDYIRDTGQAHLEHRNGYHGVVFHDEDEFIPLADLGYNQQIGFYRLSRFPDEENQSLPYAPWAVHPVKTDAGLPVMYALVSSDGHGLLLGERWQVEQAVAVLQRFLATGQTAAPIMDEALGQFWLTISEACEMAHEHDPQEFPLDESLQFRIRQAARRGSLRGAQQTPSGRWKFQPRLFRHWLESDRHW